MYIDMHTDIYMYIHSKFCNYKYFWMFTFLDIEIYNIYIDM